MPVLKKPRQRDDGENNPPDGIGSLSSSDNGDFPFQIYRSVAGLNLREAKLPIIKEIRRVTLSESAREATGIDDFKLRSDTSISVGKKHSRRF